MALTISGRVSNTGARPSAHEDIRNLLRRGRNDEAIVKLCAILVTAAGDVDAKQLLFDAFYHKRDFATAVILATELAALKPADPRVRRALIATLSDMKCYPEAIAQALRYVEEHGEEPAILDVLKVGCFYGGRKDEAVRYGQRALEIRDAEATRAMPSPPAVAPAGRRGKNVISFSLWGRAPIYCYGAMINLVLARTAYPGWICRFYVAADVPPACVAFLAANGAEVCAIEQDYPAVGQYQRFLVMNDPAVERFLVRDCDARLSTAEAALVAQWIDSSYPFHVMRDHVLHNALIMAGLWGGRADCGIDIVDLLKRHFPRGPIATYGGDQRALGAVLWPRIRNCCLVHDKHYRLAGVHTVPLTDPRSHFGAGHQDTAAVRAEAERLRIPPLT